MTAIALTPKPPRPERARLIARRVADKLATLVPPGLGRWDGAWELVEAPANAFLDALLAWQHAPDGGPDEERLRHAVDEAARAMLRAWIVAARLWEDAGRPETWAARDGASTVAA